MPNAPKNPVSINGRNYFHFRVDYKSDADYEIIIRYIKQLGSKNSLVVHEISKDVKKNHLHCIFDETLSLSRLRAKFHALFQIVDASGNTKNKYDGSHDFKEYAYTNVERVPDHIGNLPTHQEALEQTERYLCKGESRGTYDVRYFRGDYTEDVLRDRNGQYWDISDEIKKAHAMKPLDGPLGAFGFKRGTQVIIHEHAPAPRKSRSFIADVVARIEAEIEHMTDNHVLWTNDSTRLNEFEWFRPGQVKSHAAYVVKTILKMHGKNFKPYSDGQIENEYNVVVQCLADDYQTKTMMDRLKHRGNIPL